MVHFIHTILILTMMTSCAQQDKDLHTLESSLTFLTSDACMGRSTGTEGNQLAASYIADQYKTIELDTYNDQYYHNYKQSTYDPATAIQELTVFYKDGTQKSYVYGLDFLGSMIEGTSVKTQITTDIHDLDDKIILVDEHTPAFNFRKSNAVGRFKKADALFKSSHVRSDGKFSVDITNTLYDDLMSKEVDYVTYKDNVSTEEKEVNNVIGILKGKDSTHALVLSAHFDHVGFAGDTIFRGAIDNASGVAILLELAERLKKRSLKKPFDMDIVFAALNGEEYGLLGSKAFVPSIKEHYHYLYNINMDCIGKKDGGDLTVNGQREELLLNTKLQDALLKHFSESDIPISDQFYGLSDHYSFNRMNVPAVTIGQRDVLGENDTTSIHTPEDTVDIVDYDYMNRVIDVLYDFIIHHDGNMFRRHEDVSLSVTGARWVEEELLHPLTA